MVTFLYINFKEGNMVKKEEEIKREDVLEDVPEVKVSPKVKSKVVLSPEQIASRQLAHKTKVSKFLAGGEF